MAADVPIRLQLDPKLFPNEPWAKALIESLNQLSLQVTQLRPNSEPVYKTIAFTTGAAVADSFPIDIPVAGIVRELRVAQVLRGGTAAGDAISALWTMLSRQDSAWTVRVTSIAGLAVSTSYELRLAIE